MKFHSTNSKLPEPNVPSRTFGMRFRRVTSIPIRRHLPVARVHIEAHAAAGLGEPDRGQEIVNHRRNSETERRRHMNARNKLNVAYFNGSVVIASLIGLELGSWLVFFLALVVLVIANLYDGGIRPNRRN